MRIKDDPGGVLPFLSRKPGRQTRVVRQHRIHTDQNGIDLVSNFMPSFPGGLSCDPFGISRPGGDPSVEGDGRLKEDIRGLC